MKNAISCAKAPGSGFLGNLRRNILLIATASLFAALASGCLASSRGRIAERADPEADRYNRAILEFNAGMAQLADKNYTKAAEHFLKTREIHGEFFDAGLQLGITYDLFLERPDEAKKIYEKMLESVPDDYRLKKLLGIGKPKIKIPRGEKRDEKKKPAEKPAGETKNAALIRARAALKKADFRLALREFQDSFEEELTGAEETEVLLGKGVCYGAINQDDPARDMFEQVLKRDPRVALEEGKYPDRVYGLFAEVQARYPSPLSLVIKTAQALVLMEPIVFEYSVTAACKFNLRITPLGERDVLLDKTVEMKSDALSGEFGWNAGESPGFELRPRSYKIELTASGPKDWKRTRVYVMNLTGNFDTKLVREVAWKEDRIRSIRGQVPITHIPGKKRWELVEKPKKVSWRGALNWPYYCTIGAIRDGLDFPIKFLYSVPGLGHVLTIAHPVTAYTAVKAGMKVDRDDYYDPFWGMDKGAYNSDKRRVEFSSVGAALASFFVIPAVGAVVSWAGTDDGIVKGFKSYYKSNAFDEGYKSEYFFPNWRSLDFTVVRDDPEREEVLMRMAATRNAKLNAEIGKVNAVVTKFNQDKFSKFKTGLFAKARKELRKILMVDLKLDEGRDAK